MSVPDRRWSQARPQPARSSGGCMQEIERCQHCGTPRALAGGSPHCATCGRKFPRRTAVPPSPDEPPGSEAGPGWLLAPPRRTDAGSVGTAGRSSGGAGGQPPPAEVGPERGGRWTLARRLRPWVPVGLLGAVGSGLLAVLAALALRSSPQGPTGGPHHGLAPARLGVPLRRRSGPPLPAEHLAHRQPVPYGGVRGHLAGGPRHPGPRGPSGRVRRGHAADVPGDGVMGPQEGGPPRRDRAGHRGS